MSHGTLAKIEARRKPIHSFLNRLRKIMHVFWWISLLKNGTEMFGTQRQNWKCCFTVFRRLDSNQGNFFD